MLYTQVIDAGRTEDYVQTDSNLLWQNEFLETPELQFIFPFVKTKPDSLQGKMWFCHRVFRIKDAGIANNIQ